MTNNIIAHLPSSQMEVDLFRALRRIKALEEDVRKLQALVVPGERWIRAVQGTQVFRISLPDILYFRAESNYTRIVLKTGKAILTSRTLKSWTEEVWAHGFLRCHKSYLVNTAEIQGFQKHPHQLLLLTGELLPVSRGCRKAALDPSLWGCEKPLIQSLPKPACTVHKLTESSEATAYTFGA